jgi:methionyl-tRNA formyltransferase
MVTPLRIVFFGTPQFAVPTLQHLLTSHHPVVGVVTQPDRPRGRGQRVSDSPVKTAARAANIPIYQPERLRDEDVLDALRRLQPDLGVVAAYGKLIPQAMLDIPTRGMINVHASLLPRYRGAAPVHRAVIAGDAETGVTIMRVIRELDAGGMFAAVTRRIGQDETSDVVERDLAQLGGALLVAVVDQLAEGTAREQPQDASRATYAPKLTKDEGLIDWTRPAGAIHNQVRGLHPWPHAYTFMEGTRIIVLRTRLTGSTSDAPAGAVVGTGADGIQVVAGGSATLAIELLQPEGKRPMDARDFVAGRPLAPGTVLGRR